MKSIVREVEVYFKYNIDIVLKVMLILRVTAAFKVAFILCNWIVK